MLDSTRLGTLRGFRAAVYASCGARRDALFDLLDATTTAGLLEELTGVALGTETLRTHAEEIGTELEGQQQATQTHVQREHAPPAAARRPVADLLVVETDGVLVRYRDRRLDGSVLPGDWHEVKLGRCHFAAENAPGLWTVWNWR